jgi:hypothetical protein
MGPKAEGGERAWLGRHRRKTGRKTRRCSARDARAILHEPLRRGKTAAVPALQAALGALEAKWGWTRELRQRLVIRLDGGFGTTAVRPWLLSRGSQVVAKMSHRGRVRQLGQQIGPWQPTAREGRAIAAGLAPRRCCRNTRHWVIRTPQETGRDQDAVWVTTLLELPPAELADRYDGRALMEAPLGQDNQGRGLVKRRQRQGEAPQMVWLLVRLAHHLLVWSQRWLSRVPAIRWRLHGYGVVRLLQEVWTVPGVIGCRRGWMVSVHFNPLHPWAKVLQQGFVALFRGRVRVRCLR